MVNKLKDVVIVSAVRTPIGVYRGSLKDMKPDQLGSLVIKEVLKKSEFIGDEIDIKLFQDIANEEFSPKLYKAAEIARKLAKEGRKTLIWSYFVHNVESLATKLLQDLDAQFIHGGVEVGSSDDIGTREWKIKKFNTHIQNHIKSNRTIDLIKYLKKKNKKSDLYFIMGADNLINFHKWEKYKSIIKLCKILVFDRSGYKSKALKSLSFRKYNKKNIEFIKFNKVNISSSQLRKI